MVLDVSKISGIDNYEKKNEKERVLYLKDEKVFLVIRSNTIELRCDKKLADLLQEK